MDKAKLKQQFDADGFVFIPGFFSGDDLLALQTRLGQFIREVIPNMPSNEIFYEDKSKPETLKQFQGLDANDSFFKQLFREGKLKHLAEVVLGDEVVPQTLQYFNKPPQSGKPTPPHQDGYYFKLDPCEAVTMWLALDHVDEQNGCVHYVRGSHKHGMRQHEKTDVLGFSQGISDFGRPEDIDNEIPMPAKPGDLLIHHALTVHRAGGNLTTDRTRRSLGGVYFAKSSRQNVTALNEYESSLQKELVTTGKV